MAVICIGWQNSSDRCVFGHGPCRGKGSVSNVFVALPRLAFLLIVVGLMAATPRVALATLFLSYDQADNAVDVAPNGAPLSAETQRLFRAVREGDLGAAQQAVLDGADILAVNADGQNAADLAESLNEFTITHFLRAYQAIEDRSGASTTVLETEQPAPIPPAAPESIPESAVTAASPLSGEGIVPSVETVGVEEPPLVEVPSTSPETTSATIAPPSSDLFGETGSSLAGSTGAEVAHTQEPGGEEVSGDYFSRLAKLNPAHQPVSSEAVASPPEPEIAQSPAPEPMAVAEAGDTSVLEEESGVPADGEADGMVEQRPSDGKQFRPLKMNALSSRRPFHRENLRRATSTKNPRFLRPYNRRNRPWKRWMSPCWQKCRKLWNRPRAGI